MPDINTNLEILQQNTSDISIAVESISTAITNKGGTVPENPGLVDFPSAINTIPSEGGGGTTGPGVVFYDYDGTVVQTYTATEFANLSSMPANPTHAGLTAQGWNWSLSDAKEYVAEYGNLNIGQMYITSDGKTRLYYTIPKDSLTLDLYLYLNDDTELDIDWGDGSEHTIWTSDDGDESKSHEYSDGGRYTVAITVVSGGFSFSSSGSENYTLRNVEIGSDVTDIETSAFYNCQALSSITIPNSVGSIRGGAFSNCWALSSVTIPNGVTSIEESTFQSCFALTSITIPNNTESIGNYAFEGCEALSLITIPNSVTEISDFTFYDCHALTSITIPNSVTSIGGSAFYDCYALSSITIPNSVGSIRGGAFCDCRALSSITIPNSVESIGDSAFFDCYALSSITIPNSVIEIKSSAFYNCCALTSITIPNSVESIGYEAFYCCNALSSITFESTTPPELTGDLSLPTTCTIRVPQGTLSDYTSANNYPDPSQYIYEEYTV